MSSLSGQSALVSGADSAFGRAIAEALVGAGVEVARCDTRVVSQVDDVVRAVERALDGREGLDVWVHAAQHRVVTPLVDPWERALEQWDEIMTTNLRGALLVGRVCAPHLVAAGGGQIVLLTSSDVLPARAPGANPPDRDIECASRWALNGFTQAWALALARRGVRVNALAVGPDELGEAEGVAASRTSGVASVLLELLREGPGGRSGENIDLGPHAPLTLPPPRPSHRAITG